MKCYKEDVASLVELIGRFRENGQMDASGLVFNTVCDAEILGHCRNRLPVAFRTDLFQQRN